MIQIAAQSDKQVHSMRKFILIEILREESIKCSSSKKYTCIYVWEKLLRAESHMGWDASSYFVNLHDMI